MRRPFIAGNWKMHKTIIESVELVEGLVDELKGTGGVETGVCPPFTSLAAVVEAAEQGDIVVGAQNMYFEDEGAYTGEISPQMILDTGAEYVILGHSERREIFGETDEGVNRKVLTAFEAGLKPIICVGESLEEREKGLTADKVTFQVKAALQGLTPDQIPELVIAYEPLWAIGTGKSASAGDAQEVIAEIRQVVSGEFGEVAQKMRIQYGGSVKPHNIEEFMAEEDIDGALVGGASLDVDSFQAIVRKTAEMG